MMRVAVLVSLGEWSYVLLEPHGIEEYCALLTR